MSATVKHTCPDIDNLIGILETSVKEIRLLIRQNDLPSDIERELDNIADNIEDTYYRGVFNSKTSIIEQLRKSNEELREWGEGMERELDNIYHTLQK